MPTQGLDDIPAKTINIDPAASGPFGLWQGQKCRQCLIVEPLEGQAVFREVDDGNLARSAQCRHGSMAAIRFARIHTWFGAGCRGGHRCQYAGRQEEAGGGLRGQWGSGMDLRCQPRGTVKSLKSSTVLKVPARVGRRRMPGLSAASVSERPRGALAEPPAEPKRTVLARPVSMLGG